MHLLSGSLTAVLAVCYLLTAAAEHAATNPVVVTPLGKVQGVYCSEAPNVSAYLAIPYAKPPVGNLRWAVPQEFTKRYPVAGLNATVLPSKCTQSGDGQEDCLYLNIYTPARATPNSKLPVRFFIHGGSLEMGSANDANGCQVVDDADVVSVHINYRLGAFGFMALPELRATSSDLRATSKQWTGTVGNWGTLDQRLALEWVQKNIANFGGNPQKVLLYGESAGCWSVITQMLMPKAEGLFSSAACQSEGLGNLMGETYKDTSTKSLMYKQALGCSNDIENSMKGFRSAKECMLSKSTFEVQIVMDFKPPGDDFNLAATVDGVVLTDTPLQLLKRGAVVKVPFLAGFNAWEGSSLVPGWYGPLLSGEATDITEETYQGFVNETKRKIPSSLIPAYLSQYNPSNPELGSRLRSATAYAGDNDVHCASFRTIRLMADAGVPVYAYHWTQPASNGCLFLQYPLQNGVLPDGNSVSRAMTLFNSTHAAELYEVFRRTNSLIETMGVPCGYEEKQMASFMSGLWNAHAATGVPANPISRSLTAPHLKAAPAWPRFTTSNLQFYVLNYYKPGPVDMSAWLEKCLLLDLVYYYDEAVGSFYTVV